MHDDSTTILTTRGQTSVPARLRRIANLKPGQKLRWEQVSKTEFRVTLPPDQDTPGPLAALGWARRFHSGEPRPTDETMRELREGESD